MESGAKYKKPHKKKKYALGRQPTMTKIDDEDARVKIRVRGGNGKSRLLRVKTANVFDPKKKKHSKTEIIQVLENPANRHYVRRNIITKGTVIKTKAGKAKVTSRPGQDGVVNAVLV